MSVKRPGVKGGNCGCGSTDPLSTGTLATIPTSNPNNYVIHTLSLLSRPPKALNLVRKRIVSAESTHNVSWIKPTSSAVEVVLLLAAAKSPIPRPRPTRQRFQHSFCNEHRVFALTLASAMLHRGRQSVHVLWDKAWMGICKIWRTTGTTMQWK